MTEEHGVCTAEENSVCTAEEHRQALTEVSFILDIFAHTVDELMGGASVSVGRIAGRRMARKLPLYLPEPTLENVVAALAACPRIGARVTLEDEGRRLGFANCAVHAVCKNRGLELGGSLCSVFHYYVDGIINELVGRPLRSRILTTGDTCTAELELR